VTNADIGEPGSEQVLDLRVTGGRPTDEELAAVTAVLHAAVAEQAANPQPLVVPDGRHWQRANGFLRGPLRPGPREWRSF
jgi:hypothetical protein